MAGARPIRHAARDVHIYVARLVPPWVNVGIVISDGDRTAVATVPIVLKSKVTRALNGAGFRPIEHSTWLDHGWRHPGDTPPYLDV
jgi:hypothetical protein